MTDKKIKNRDSFRSKWGFIMACIGSAVGMGNIWMFPTRVSAYGGGTFLLPYFIFVILIGFSGVIEEMSFGRGTKSGPVGAFGQAMATKGHEKLGRAIGVLPMLGALALAIGYSVVVGWILKYAVGALTGAVLKPESIDGFGEAFGSMASAFGNNGWQLAGLIITFVIMALGVAGGIEKANKVMMPLFFLMFAGLAVYMLFQPGASEGYSYIFRIDPEGLTKSHSLGVCTGTGVFLPVSGGKRNADLRFLSFRKRGCGKFCRECGSV